MDNNKNNDDILNKKPSSSHSFERSENDRLGGNEGDHDSQIDKQTEEVQQHNIFEKGDIDTSMQYPKPQVLPMTPRSEHSKGDITSDSNGEQV